jgi:hypothetical protein
MKKIVFEHYPVSKLPADLREGLGDVATVRVVIEVEPQSSDPASDRPEGGEPLLRRGPIQRHEIMALRERILADGRASVSEEEAVARIRELRDEWDY